ncbi:hypothetical protein [Roseibium sp. M-1]
MSRSFEFTGPALTLFDAPDAPPITAPHWVVLQAAKLVSRTATSMNFHMPKSFQLCWNQTQSEGFIPRPFALFSPTADEKGTMYVLWHPRAATELPARESVSLQKAGR